MEERGPGGCLMNLSGDATITVKLHLGEEETTWARQTLCKCGSKNAECRKRCTGTGKTCTSAPTQREQFQAEAPVTQFRGVREKLWIPEILAVVSPQATGRVEQNYGTHQDHLIKKMTKSNIPNFHT
jgi:hypothetical protein